MPMAANALVAVNMAKATMTNTASVERFHANVLLPEGVFIFMYLVSGDVHPVDGTSSFPGSERPQEPLCRLRSTAAIAGRGYARRGDFLQRLQRAITRNPSRQPSSSVRARWSDFRIP